MRRRGLPTYRDAMRPDYEGAVRELRRSLWYRFGAVLMWRIVLADFALWFLVGGVAAALGVAGSRQRAIGGAAISVFLLATAFAAVIAVPHYLAARRCCRMFGIDMSDPAWNRRQVAALWRDVFTMPPRVRGPDG